MLKSADTYQHITKEFIHILCSNFGCTWWPCQWSWQRAAQMVIRHGKDRPPSIYEGGLTDSFFSSKLSVRPDFPSAANNLKKEPAANGSAMMLNHPCPHRCLWQAVTASYQVGTKQPSAESEITWTKDNTSNLGTVWFTHFERTIQTNANRKRPSVNKTRVWQKGQTPFNRPSKMAVALAPLFHASFAAGISVSVDIVPDHSQSPCGAPATSKSALTSAATDKSAQM